MITRSTAMCASLTLAMLLGTVAAAAQTDEEFDKIFPFIGNWDGQVDSPNGQDRGNCGGRLGDYGEKLVNCTMPVDQLPLNARAEAWLKYVDQPAVAVDDGMCADSVSGGARRGQRDHGVSGPPRSRSILQSVVPVRARSG